MKNAYKYLILMCLLLTCLGALAWLDPIPQNPSYHQFSDQKILMGIPNGLNVLSNLPFCILGAFSFGFVLLKKNSLLFSSGWHRLAWLCVFAGVFFVGLGSGYYHWMPSNRTLVWDRLPMTIVFMSFSAVLWMERIPVKEGPFTLVLFNVVGLFSIWYWQFTESKQCGDLRLYAFVQFAPMVLLPALLILFRRGPVLFPSLAGVFVFYAAAKWTEYADAFVFKWLVVVSGHTLKHLLACISVWYMLHILLQRRHIAEHAGIKQEPII